MSEKSELHKSLFAIHIRGLPCPVFTPVLKDSEQAITLTATSALMLLAELREREVELHTVSETERKHWPGAVEPWAFTASDRATPMYEPEDETKQLLKDMMTMLEIYYELDNEGRNVRGLVSLGQMERLRERYQAMMKEGSDA